MNNPDSMASLLGALEDFLDQKVAQDPTVTGSAAFFASALKAIAEEAPQSPFELADLAPGDEVGPYRIVERIGEGGMGTVYVAEQSEPLKRRVALKVIQQGLDSREFRARFDMERQALTMMEHANIAQILDAGVTTTGRPYFVMEYVSGEPVNSYCDRERLNNEDRLKLFQAICRGVQHAHQKGIIHRDLKPSNILVSVQDGKAVPKIIDFGVAKATIQALVDQSMQTAVGRPVGTPEYMSPEQASTTESDIDTRADVYSLGVLLYELLTGALPFDSAMLRSAGPVEAQRIIREVDPPRPSTRVSTGADSEAAATSRRTDKRTLVRRLRADLDWITMRALEKDRTRRYSTAAELAMEIGRHLSHEPVLAGPPSVRYRAGRFLRRYRGAVTVVTVVLAALSIGLGWALQERARAQTALAAKTEALDEKTKALAQLEVIADFMEEVLQEASPWASGGMDTRLLQRIMEDAAARIEKGAFKELPEADFRLRLLVSGVFVNIAAIDKATGLLANIRENARKNFGDGSPQFSAAVRVTGQHALILGDVATARDNLELHLALQRTLHGAGSDEVAHAMTQIARCHLHDQSFPAGLQVARESIKVLERSTDVSKLADAYYMAGKCLTEMGSSAEALPLFEKRLELRREVYQKDHPRIAEALRDVASCMDAVGLYPKALPRFEEAIAMSRRLIPEDSLSLHATLSGYANCLLYAGRRDEALSVFEETVSIQQRLLPEGTPGTARILQNMAQCLILLNRPQEALEKLDEAAAIQAKLLPEGHSSRIDTKFHRAFALSRVGEQAAALELWDEALGLAEAAGPGLRMTMAQALSHSAEVLQAQGRFDEALPRLERTVVIYRDANEGDSMDLVVGLANLGYCLQMMKRYQDALPKYQEATQIRRRLFGNDSEEIAKGLWWLTSCMADLGMHEEALPLLEEAVQINKRVLPPGSFGIAACLESLANGLGALDRHLEAAEKHREAAAIYESLGETDVRGSGNLINLARSLLLGGQSEEALAPAEQAVRQLTTSVPPEALPLAVARTTLGQALVATKKFREAEPVLLKAASQLGEGTPARFRKRCFEALAAVYESIAAPEKAQEWREKVPAVE